MTVRNFVRAVRTLFEKIVESSKMAVSWSFLDYFWLCCKITVIRFRWHCTLTTLKWCRMTEENFVRTVRTGFEKIAKSSKRTVFWSFLDYFWLCCQITVIRVWCHCTHGTLKWRRMTRKFRSTDLTFFLETKVSQIPAIQFWCHCRNRTLVWCGRTGSYRSNRWNVFWKKRKRFTIGHFLVT